ncbi:unnamed protein product [Effrenium voratum]|nr:unnamed protein product [Effrenium voratum]
MIVQPGRGASSCKAIYAGEPRASSAPRMVPQMCMQARYSPQMVLPHSPVPRVQVVVQRQCSSPLLSKPIFVVSPVSPGVKCVCEPLPTWAAPATPPRREVPTAVAVGAGAAGAGAGMCCDGDTSAPSEDWHKSVSSDDTLDTQRARLEATRKELMEKMSQLRKLEASLSLAVGDAEDLEKDEKHEKDEKDEKEENEEKDEKDEKDEKEDAVPLAPRGPRDLGARRSKAVATDTDDLVALCKAERPGAVGAVGATGATGATGASQPEGEGGRRSVPRVTPSSPGPGPAGPSGPSGSRVRRRTNSPGAQRPETGKESEKESKAKEAKNEKELLHEKERPKRQSSLIRSASARSRISLFAPISARLGSRTSSRATIGAADTSGTSGSSGPSGSSGTSVLARSSSARELSRPGTGILEAADVARLVASPEIGTLDDFLPNPVPQPEVLSARAPRATPVAFLAEASALLQPPCPSCRKKYMAGATFCHNCGQKRRTPAAQASRRGSGTSPQTTPADPVPEASRTGSRMLFSQQLTCHEQPRQTPSPLRLRSTPARAKVPKGVGKPISPQPTASEAPEGPKKPTFKPRHDVNLRPAKMAVSRN